MNAAVEGRMERVVRALILSTVALAVLFLAAAIPAAAKSNKGRHHGHFKHHSHRSYSIDRECYVPTRIYAGDVATYRSWRSGRVFYQPHRHHHVVYRFPVEVDGAIVYRSYSYCRDNLFIEASVPLPRIVVKWGHSD